MQQGGCDFRDIHISGCLESLQWKEGADSSGSETGKQDLDDDFPHDTHSLGSNVQFTVGDRFVGFSVDTVLMAKIFWVYQCIIQFFIFVSEILILDIFRHIHTSHKKKITFDMTVCSSIRVYQLSSH